MPENPPPYRPVGRSGPGSGVGVDPEQTPWRQLMEAETAEELASSWLELQSRMIGGVSQGVVILESAKTGSLVPIAFWPGDSGGAPALSGIVERAIRDKKGIVQRGDGESDETPPESRPVQMAYPILVGERLAGVAALEIAPRAQIQLQSAMRQLQWGAAWLQNWVLRRTAEPETQARKRLTTALELVALALEQDGFQASATAFVTELATRLNCDRVSLGFVSRKQVKVRALSHSAEFVKQMNLFRAIGAAMTESVDQKAPLRYPDPEEKSIHVLHFHELLAKNHGDLAICTVPFLDQEGRAFGAITLERSAAEHFDRQTLEVLDSVAALAGPVLEEKRKNDRLLIVKIGDSLWAQVKKLIGPRHTLRKLITGAVVAAILFFCFATGRHRVTAKSTLEGEVRRVVTAPYRGFVFEAPVRPGDIVRKGKLMCRLDDRDMKLEQARLTSEREQYLAEQRKSMADREMAATNVLGKKMRQSEAQLSLLNEQISRAVITAPFDGIVVNGDLSQSLGAPVEAGQVLFEVAPLRSYRLVLKTDERDIGFLRAGQTGELILTALPESRFPFKVVQITPVSSAEEGRNYFRVEARLDKSSPRLRPGMEGYAKVVVGRAKLVWIWTHDLTDWIRLKLWSWLP
jgi:RND family efflux transporter MFP subunit